STAGIFSAVVNLRKWREEQFQQFQDMQLRENQKLLGGSFQKQKTLEDLAENPQGNLQNNKIAAGMSSEKTLLDCKTSDDSSLTSHFLRCFSDTSQDSGSLYENKVGVHQARSTAPAGIQSYIDLLEQKKARKTDEMAESSEKNTASKPKRPYLKKGSGLLRYMPKSVKDKESTVKYKPSIPEKGAISVPFKPVLKLKPPPQKSAFPNEKVKHIRFQDPIIQNDYEKLSVKSSNYKSEESKASVTESVKSNSDSAVLEANSSDVQENKSSSGEESLNQENQELAVFEMLEDCAQNSSFNSDSSFVQKLLHGENTLPVKSNQTSVVKPAESNMYREPNRRSVEENSGYSVKSNLNKFLDDVQARKNRLEQLISDIDPRIASLQKEISPSDRNTFMNDNLNVNERCSTPDNGLNKDIQMAVGVDECANESFDSSSSTIHDGDVATRPSKLAFHNDIPISDEYVTGQDYLQKKENLIQQETADAVEGCSPERAAFREKMKELENEIEVYQEHNARLSKLSKEREEVWKKLQKEREEFQKHKELEEQKIEEARQQIKREKDTFKRLQKLQKDNMSKKEREELTALRKEVEDLRKELKKQKIKYNEDIRRLKNQLLAAERDRDTFKLENIKLNDQCEDLLIALKARNKTKKTVTNEKGLDAENANMKYDSKITANENGIEKNTLDAVMDDEKIESVDHMTHFRTDMTKLKVHFNLKPEYDEALAESSENEIAGIRNKLQTSVWDEIEDAEDTETNAANEVEEPEYREIERGGNIERIYHSGDKEIIYGNGSRKFFDASTGITKVELYNGDVKEIFPDKSEIYRFADGIIEKTLPDGLEITELHDGQIQKRYPDGHKEIIFPDGTIHNYHLDESLEIRQADGTVIFLLADGRQIIEYKNGQRGIGTPDYKRLEYPDGSVKIVYKSGRQESRYANGRIRIKDKDGNLIVDTFYLKKKKGYSSHT
ncbi:centromere protein J-like, partial [Stegodyphus dumicola]|uniref:centromere protein J-like n=1 Tax=Stegodyphus dumicola TaxID=202533 RepID=UPI0015AEFFFC